MKPHIFSSFSNQKRNPMSNLDNPKQVRITFRDCGCRSVNKHVTLCEPHSELYNMWEEKLKELPPISRAADELRRRMKGVEMLEG